MSKSDTETTKKAATPTAPNAPKQSLDTADVDPSEQPNPGDPGPAVLRPDASSQLPKRDG